MKTFFVEPQKANNNDDEHKIIKIKVLFSSATTTTSEMDTKSQIINAT